jgi:7,8-dihydro-6-hydroxymethylpterin-pyrophosphokinase
MLETSPQLKVKGVSPIEIYAPHGTDPGYLAASIHFETSLPISALIGMAGGVEERLADPLHPGERRTLRADLMWVEGVRIKTPQIELPNPDLFTKSWAIGTFVKAAEMAINSKEEAARFYHALKTVPPPHEIDSTLLSIWIPTLARSEAFDLWKTRGDDWLEGLASAAVVLAYADVDVANATRDLSETDQDLTVEPIRAAVEDRPADRIELVEVAVPPGGDASATAAAWLAGIQASLKRSATQLATAVVFSADNVSVRGLAIGHESTAHQAIRIAGVAADRDPAATREDARAAGITNPPRFEIKIDRSLRDVQLPHQPGPR